MTMFARAMPLVILLLVGCAEQQAAKRMPRVNLSGYSVEFKDGYTDGCNSVAGPIHRDAARFDSDARYARGWRDGFSSCSKK